MIPRADRLEQPDFLAALDAAGMQTSLDAANAQLAAFLAAK